MPLAAASAVRPASAEPATDTADPAAAGAAPPAKAQAERSTSTTPPVPVPVRAPVPTALELPEEPSLAYGPADALDFLESAVARPTTELDWALEDTGNALPELTTDDGVNGAHLSNLLGWGAGATR